MTKRFILCSFIIAQSTQDAQLYFSGEIHFSDNFGVSAQTISCDL